MSMLDNDDGTDSITERMDHDASDLQESSLMFRNGHISLFGEIIHDIEPINTDVLRPTPIATDAHEKVNIVGIHTERVFINFYFGLSLILFISIPPWSKLYFEMKFMCLYIIGTL